MTDLHRQNTVTASHLQPGNRRAERPTLLVLSQDACLLEATTHVGQDRANVICSPSIDRFVDQLVAESSSLVLIDSVCVPTSLPEFVTSLRENFPNLVMMVAGGGAVHQQMEHQVQDGSIFRFLHKPASARRVGFFIEAALRQHLADRQSTLAQPDAAVDGHTITTVLDRSEEYPRATHLLQTATLRGWRTRAGATLARTLGIAPEPGR